MEWSGYQRLMCIPDYFSCLHSV